MARGTYSVVVRGSAICFLFIGVSWLLTSFAKGISYPMRMVGFFIYQLGIMGLMIFAAWGLVIWARTKTVRARPDLCLKCGYNLTGNESGVCPECATPVPKQETVVR